MATTTNYSWVTPDDTDLVAQGADAIRVLGSSADSTVYANANAATQKATLTTTGDIYYASGASTPARLGIGTSGQVLGSNGTIPGWVSPSGTTLISTTSLSGASVTLSSIAATYNSLRLVVRDFLPATDSRRLAIRFNGDAGAAYNFQRSSSTSTAQTFSETQGSISETNDNAVTNSLVVIDIPDYANTATWKLATGPSIMVDTTTTTSVRIGINTVAWNSTAAISSITLLPDTGNFTSGTVLLYGVV
jgi:hypothetical protein